MLALVVPSPSAGAALDASKITPGPVALLIVALLGVALILLIRSLRTQVRRIDFDETSPTDEGRMRGRRRPRPPGQGG